MTRGERDQTRRPTVLKGENGGVNDNEGPRKMRGERKKEQIRRPRGMEGETFGVKDNKEPRKTRGERGDGDKKDDLRPFLHDAEHE